LLLLLLLLLFLFLDVFYKSDWPQVKLLSRGIPSGIGFAIGIYVQVRVI
jgi:hypothetical protein